MSRPALWCVAGAVAVALASGRGPIRRFMVRRSGTELGQIRAGDAVHRRP